jgi:hypothetical protein
MDAPSLLTSAAGWVLLVAGLLAPGAALLRAWRLPFTPGTAFGVSAVSLYVVLLALQLTGLRISLLSLTAGLAAVTFAAWFARPRQVASETRAGTNAALPVRRFAPFTGMGAWTPLYLVFWCAVVLRVWGEPVSGPDVEFRWGFLAEQILRLGTLDFYPPRTADHFASYFWAESLPPGASALHLWAQACTGGVRSALMPAVLLTLWSIHELLWRTADWIGGLTAARLTCLAAAACPLLTWSILLGQETGLTTLALVGIVWSVSQWRDTRAVGWVALTGTFALLGAATREYGLVFPVLAATALALVQASRTAWSVFAGFALAGLIWPLRTWLLTGNPFFSLGVGDLFPVNVRFVDWISFDADAFGRVLRTVDGWKSVARFLGLYAPFAVVGWIAVVVATGRRMRGAGFALGAVLVMLVLWAASVRYTNGGLFYSLRVASPALALGVLAAGVALTALLNVPGSRPAGVAAIIGLIVAASIPLTLALPRNPWLTPWKAWPAFAPPPPLAVGAADPTVALVLGHAGSAAVGSATVLPDSPGYQRRFQPTGMRVVPLWSPDADWLFDASLSPAEIRRRWQESGIRYLIITKWQANFDFFHTRSRWQRPPIEVQSIGETPATAVFLLRVAD